MRKRFKAVLMLSVWILGIINGLALEVSAALLPEVLSVKNKVIELIVNEQDGRYAIKTVEGSLSRQGDEKEPLLFSREVPETTFTTFRIDGKDYIYGNSYTGVSMDGGFTSTPKTEGMINTSSWRAEGIEITQRLEMLEDLSGSDVGNVKVSYLIENKGAVSKQIGTRVLLDTMLGDNDGAKISLNGSRDVSFETEVYGEDIPLYWRTTDSEENPKVVAYGFLKGWGNKEPDKMTIAHWSSLSSTKWDYTIDPKRNIGSTLNDYKSADSAVALYWEPVQLEPGKSIQVETYYGLGNINASNDGSTFNLNLHSPAKLTIAGDRYLENPFKIVMELDNTLSNSTELAGITAELVLPEGLELAEGEESSKYFYRINANGKLTAEWSVKAANTQKLKVLQYMVRVSTLEKELKNAKKYIIVPGFEQEGIEIAYNDIVPRNIYYADESKSIQLIGRGFELLKDKSSYSVSILNNEDASAYSLSTDDITIINDNQLNLKLPKDMKVGQYRVSINHRNDILDYTLPQLVNLSTEEKYKSRNYGIMAIKHESSGAGSIRLYENEAELTTQEKNDSKLIIRGKIRKYNEDSYEVYGDSISINNDVYFKGYGSKMLSVNKEGSSFTVRGNGELYMQSSLMGSKMEITLKKGHFHIDSKTASVKDTDGEFNDISIIYVGYIPILVKDIKILASGETKIDGLLELDNKYFNYLTSVSSGSLKSDLKDLGISSKNIEIDAELKVPFPRWKLGNFQSKDYAKKSITDVTFYINTKKGEYGFETKAENPTLRLLDLNAKLGFDKNLFPDYFEFKNEYGKVPEPIGSTGLAFERIGGGIYGLRSLFDSLRKGVWPTGTSVVATADIADLLTYHSGRIKGKTMIGLNDIKAILDSSGLSLSGNANFYFIPVGSLHGQFDFSGGYVEANVNFLDIIISKAYLSIRTSEIKGSIEAEVRVPKKVWFIGGETIAGYKAGFTTKKIEGSIRFLGVGVGIAYSWVDNDLDFDVGSKSDIRNKGIYTATQKDSNGQDVVVSYGTNIYELGDIEYNYKPRYVADARRTLAYGVSEYEYIVELQDTVEAAIIEMQYDSDKIPQIRVKDPDGNSYTLKEDENYRIQIIPADESDSKKEEKRIFVTITEPIPGQWKFISDQELKAELFGAYEPVAFESLSASLKDDKIKVEWKLNKTKDTFVDLYLIREDGASEMLLLTEKLAVDSDSYEFNIPDTVTSGSYKLYAEVTRNGSFDNMYSKPFEFVDAMAPEAPKGFTVINAGNGLFEAKWAKSSEVDEYRIYAVDASGKLDSTVKAMVSVAGNESGVTFGKTQTDSDGIEYGWFSGRNYRFALYAVKSTKSGDETAEHISNAAISGEIYLQVPEPPEFTAEFTAEYGSINYEANESGTEVGYVNINNIKLDYKSASSANVIISLNGSKAAEHRAAEFVQELQLIDGSNLIELEVTGENGDKAFGVYELYYDNTAPDLMVQSPGIDNNVFAGEVEVSGRTTAGSKLYLNGAEIDVEEDGSFTKVLALSGIARETVTITATDIAGNSTEYSAEVINSAVTDVVGVKLMPEIKQLRAGDKVQLKLYGVTKDNRTVLLEAEKISWQLYDSAGLAAITEDGLLSAKSTGEIAINALYEYSKDIIYQDALLINILPKENNYDDDDDDDDDDKGNGSRKDIVSDKTVSDNQSGSMIKKAMNFRANEEIVIPGLLRLKLTADEIMDQGYIEVTKNDDFLQYSQNIGSKAYLSSIFDITVTEGYSFNSTVELTIYFDSSKVKNIERIGIYIYNEKTRMWERQEGIVDAANASVTIKCPHFSKFAVMEDTGMTIMEDMKGHWAREAVYRLIDKGIVSGIKGADGKYRFEPERTISRAEFAKLLATANDFTGAEPEKDLTGLFKDWESTPAWAKPYFAYCASKGWISGSKQQDGSYVLPDRKITRAEAAAMLGRTLDQKPIQGYGYIDKEDIPLWAQEPVKKLLSLKIIRGYSDNSFRPNGWMTRAEAAVMFDNYMKLRR